MSSCSVIVQVLPQVSLWDFCEISDIWKYILFCIWKTRDYFNFRHWMPQSLNPLVASCDGCIWWVFFCETLYRDHLYHSAPISLHQLPPTASLQLSSKSWCCISQTVQCSREHLWVLTFKRRTLLPVQCCCSEKKCSMSYQLSLCLSYLWQFSLQKCCFKAPDIGKTTKILFQYLSQLTSPLRPMWTVTESQARLGEWLLPLWPQPRESLLFMKSCPKLLCLES